MQPRLVAELTDTSIFYNPNKPPVAVAVVQKYHGISLGCIGLPIDRCDEIVQRVDELEINVLCS